MAEEPEGIELTEADIESFVEKLDKWGQSLSEGERGMLHLLLARAEAGAEASEVEGYGFGTIAAPGAGFGSPSLPSPGLRAGDLLRPVIGSTPLFFSGGNVAGTYSSWGRG
jgi:hypothetical protein